jgi:hypothetical protein
MGDVFFQVKQYIIEIVHCTMFPVVLSADLHASFHQLYGGISQGRWV